MKSVKRTLNLILNGVVIMVFGAGALAFCQKHPWFIAAPMFLVIAYIFGRMTDSTIKEMK